MMNSKIIIPHKEDCKSVQYVKDKRAPFEWNVFTLFINLKPQYDNELNLVDPEQNVTVVVFEICCGDKSCPALKIINSKAIGLL